VLSIYGAFSQPGQAGIDQKSKKITALSARLHPKNLVFNMVIIYAVFAGSDKGRVWQAINYFFLLQTQKKGRAMLDPALIVCH